MNFGPWPSGMDMRSADDVLPESNARLLVDYVPSQDGTLSPRDAVEVLLPLAAASSLFAHAGSLYFIDSGQLFSYVPGATPVATGIFAPSATFVAHADCAYGWAGTHALCIQPDGTIRGWGLKVEVRDADGVLLGPPPVGDLIASFGGVLLIAKENVVRWTEPFMPDVCDLHAAAITLPFEVLLMAPTQNGVWFAGRDSCVFAAGTSPLTWTLSRIFSVGALGSAYFTDKRDAQTVYWLSDSGVVQAGGGVAVAPQRGAVSLGGSVPAALEYQPGVFVFALDDASTPHAHADFIDTVTASGV